MLPLAYAGHYHHAAGSGVDWLINAVVHAVIVSTVGLTLPEVLLVAGIAVVAFLAYRGRQI